MSRQAEAKRLQGYRRYPRKCGNCKSYMSEGIKCNSVYYSGFWYEEKNRRCKLGNFAVLKTGYCDKHKWREKD